MLEIRVLSFRFRKLIRVVVRREGSHTMLTRNFYPREGVGEALLLSFSFASRDPLRKQKSVYWAYELIQSEEEEYLWEILKKVVEKYGCAKDQALWDAKQLLPLLTSLLSVAWPTPYGPPAPQDCAIPEGLPEVPVAWTVQQRARLWWAVQDAKRHQRPERLLRLLGSLPISVAAQYLQTQKGGWRRMLEAVGCPWNPVVRPGTPLEWPRQTRLFALPKHLQSRTPLHPAGWSVWNGCRCWRRILAAHGALGPGCFQDVEQEEAFYSTYFPQDLPDEWSPAELAKSHANSSSTQVDQDGPASTDQ